LWEEYFVFATVRNPWLRARSSFNYETTRQTKYWRIKDIAELQSHVTLVDFCRDPTISIDAFHDPSISDAHHILTTHASLQHPGLFTRDSQPAFDSLIRVENMQEDVENVIAIINSRLSPGVQPIPIINLPPPARDASLYCGYLKEAGGSCFMDGPFFWEQDAKRLGYKFPCVESM
jgi:hypothetical protein